MTTLGTPISPPDQKEVELLPCPFCGSDAHWSPTFIDSDTPGTVSCAGGCGSTVIIGGSKAERIAAWNRRATLHTPVVTTQPSEVERAYDAGYNDALKHSVSGVWPANDKADALARIATLRPKVSATELRAIGDIAAERLRQVQQEGWTPEHDDEHSAGELADAAACYARGKQMSAVWPWADAWWKPGTDRRRQLVKAGALIVAEIERLDRLDQEGR